MSGNKQMDRLPDVRADVLDGLMSRLEAFSDEFERLAHTDEQKALAGAFGDLVAEVHTGIRYMAEATREYGPVNTRVMSPQDQFKAILSGGSLQILEEQNTDQPEARYYVTIDQTGHGDGFAVCKRDGGQMAYIDYGSDMEAESEADATLIVNALNEYMGRHKDHSQQPKNDYDRMLDEATDRALDRIQGKGREL
jgi:hypothetical protein